MVADRVKALVTRKRIQRGDYGGDVVNKGPEGSSLLIPKKRCIRG